MPWLDFVWSDVVIAKIEERGITLDEVQELVEFASDRDIESSYRTGLPLIRGEVSTGRYLVVVFTWVDAITIRVVTAYTPDRD